MRVVLVVIEEGMEKGKTIPVTASPILIGRGPTCHVRPASHGVSQRHCTVALERGQVVVRDLGSTNGTFVNDELVHGEKRLGHGDRLRVGPLEFIVRIQSGTMEDEPNPASRSQTPPDQAEAVIDASTNEGDLPHSAEPTPSEDDVIPLLPMNAPFAAGARRALPPPEAPLQPSAERPRPHVRKALSAEEVVHAYCKAKSWRDRLTLVTDPDLLQSVLQAGDRLPLFGQPNNITLASADHKEKKAVAWVRAEVNIPVRKTEHGFLVDWPALTGHNTVSFKDFCSRRPIAPVRFRVTARLDSTFHDDFRGLESSHLSALITADGEPNYVHGYIAGTSAEGKRLARLLADGNARQVILELQHIGPTGDYIEQPGRGSLSIIRLVSDSWLML
jgi:pSer/pThr/pTyr-binding forkhead associated (FHA) protein